MRVIRRSLQVVALVGTLLVGIVAVALIVSQTPWFKDWLRRYVVRESKQYLNGELTIGKLGGNLFYGVQLSDVAVDVSGERIVAVKGLEVDYNVFTLLSKGVVLDEIKLVEPNLRVEKTADGWNLGKLIKEQRKEAEREGPARPLSLPSIEIADGSLTIDDNGGTNGYSLPNRIDDLDVRATFEYAPVHYSIGLDHVSFRAASPALTLQELKGDIAVREDNLYFEQVQLKTADSSVRIDGVIERYLQTPVIKVTTTATVSLPEIGRIVPAASGYALHPAFEVKANGPADRLALDIDVKSEAGNVRGQVTADVKAPDLRVKGRLNLQRLNLAPILKNPAQKSDLTGDAQIDLTMASRPAAAPVLDRLSGTYAFSGPHVAAAGYEARNVRATGTLAGGRITLDARANAYGGTATAAGFILPPSKGRPLAFDLRGRANNVDLTNLPAAVRAPKLKTNLSVAEYHVRGAGRQITGTATLNESIVEGATIRDGTVAEFGSNSGVVSYAARGGVSDLNLQRLGKALRIAALSKPEYDSRVSGQFDVRGSGTALETMTLDASGTLTDTAIMGARLPEMAFDTHLADRALDIKVKGSFEHLDPARIAGQERLRGQVTGSADASIRIADLTQPMTPDSIDASGQVTIAPSIVGALQIEHALVQGTYADRIGDLATLEMKGPDLGVTASGRIALDRSSSSNVKYHIDATNLAELGKLAGQEGLGGAATIDGTLTGNAASLQTTGTLDGGNLSFQGNNALDLNSTFIVDVPELTFADAKVEANTDAVFVKAGGLEINELKAKTTYAQKQLGFSANLKERTRELDATGEVIFHPDHQEIHLPQLAIRTEGQEWRTAPGTEPTIQYGGSQLTFQNVKLVSGDQAIAVSGALALEGESPSSEGIKVEATNLDLAQLERLLLQNRGISGRLSANMTVAGTARQPVVDGHAEIVDGGFQTYKYQGLKADLDYRGNRIELNATLQQSPTELITAQGFVPMSLFQRSEGGHVAPTAEDRVDLHIKSTDLGLGIIQGFTTVVTNVAGTMQADVRLTGSGQDPHLEGHVDIRDGAFGVPLGGVSYSGLTTRIDFEQDVVRIRDFQLRDEHGEPLTVSGQLAVHQRQAGAVDINIASDNFEIIDNQLGDVGLDTTLKITGEFRRPRIEGQVRIEAGRIEVDEVLQYFYDPYAVEARPDVLSAERVVEGSGSAEQATREALTRTVPSATPAVEEKAAEEPEQTTSAFAPVALEVRLVIPDNLVLRGNDLRPGGPTRAALGDMNITVGGDLIVRKAPDGPVTLTGQVTTIRGTYEFQSRRFDLVRGGTLRFTGDTKINPLLDVTAQRLIPNTGVEARIRVTGTLEKPELELSSTPPLEESDILALIVFNRPVNELGTGERASLAATAGGIATGFIAAPLGDSIGRALDLDLFEITTNTESGEFGAGVTIGQQVADRVFFKLRQEFGERNVSEFLIEFQISQFLRLQASGSPETSGSANRIGERRIERAGMDLIFFFSY